MELIITPCSSWIEEVEACELNSCIQDNADRCVEMAALSALHLVRCAMKISHAISPPYFWVFGIITLFFGISSPGCLGGKASSLITLLVFRSHYTARVPLALHCSCSNSFFRTRCCYCSCLTWLLEKWLSLLAASLQTIAWTAVRACSIEPPTSVVAQFPPQTAAFRCSLTALVYASL